MGSEALSFGSKAAKAALDSGLRVKRGGGLGEGWRGRRVGRVCTRLENENENELN